ncbi:MAG TPA: hypothetical protein VK574_12685 [Terracidiphilus sp.]|jgi:hypothetical protein|nr:hypothetical protein [Terracidiphilus sp.]
MALVGRQLRRFNQDLLNVLVAPLGYALDHENAKALWKKSYEMVAKASRRS